MYVRSGAAAKGGAISLAEPHPLIVHVLYISQMYAWLREARGRLPPSLYLDGLAIASLKLASYSVKRTI